MNLKKVNKMYFLGIGGIGMSALARYFKQEGKQIFGYDLTASPLTRQLETEGMSIHFAEDPAQIPPDIDLVVYTPAIPDKNRELIYFQKKGIPLIKRARLIGQLSHDFFTIAIAGTHGKTSISAITAHILKAAGLNLTALVGGICINYGSNFISSETTDYLLLEADEFDRSFLNLHPNIALISSMDADHLDIYNNPEELINSFKKFATLVNKKGTFIHHKSLPAFDLPGVQTLTYGIHPEAGVRAANIRVNQGQFLFDLETQQQKITAIAMQIPGYHYVENALAAASICLQLGINGNQIKSGLESFNGVERRFEIRINTPKQVFIDDYAHHPEEIKATVKAVQMLFPGKTLTAVFQPHLFSRTKDFADEFAAVLSAVDQIILLDIYPAREQPIPGVTSANLLAKIKSNNKSILSKSELLDYLATTKPELLLTMGAGDIGLLTNEIENLLREE